MIAKTSPYEFHVSRHARARFGFPDHLFGFDGNVVLADFRAAREFAARMNATRDLAVYPEHAVRAGDINAMGLIDEVLHLVLARHRQLQNARIMADAIQQLETELGEDQIEELLVTFVDEFPPRAVLQGELTPHAYIAGSSNGVPQRQVVLEELLLLWLANHNPAFAPFRELFDDERLQSLPAYSASIDCVLRRLDDEPPTDARYASLLDLLTAPMRAAPDSLAGQLEFIRTAWAELVGPVLVRLLGSLDLIAEESKPFFGLGPGPVEVPVYPAATGEDEGEPPERYSMDSDWMPRLVLLAKNTYVWLDQLSRRYERAITTLDQVPDAELGRLAGWGITGLWLIGVWERSRASRRIKQMMGDGDAVASAYSLKDYTIDPELGGEAAYADLRHRAWHHGIRLSTDMVPNHVGIDSRWIIQHPDWFVSRRDCPFPTYSFNGPDLSDDERVGIFLEDHYYDRSDAAVVFKRVDRWTGDELYIYHGNDGTSMPWNDTAQLDYRNPEVREAVIRTILHVASLSPVIRFDAAMTLTKKNFQRLWFPEPGHGGDIPSRAECGMSRHDFDRVMPEEFWREVVDRVATDAPDTLLLAEAFWLLEGYFVRSLGMHRVYNSAFMNMLHEERNADYRQLIKNTLEYDPQILKRYVNFMSNPDERTAIDQFGVDDKYFGVATMMATLPGLPMFGHGQIEGFAEKYGMEFRRPRWDETVNEGLVRRHELQLFPLLHRRQAFAEVDRFRLFDLVVAGGAVDENVFAYCNEHDGQRSLVVFNNCYGSTAGWLRMSTAVVVRSDDGDRRLERESLADALGVPDDEGVYLVLRDLVAGLEYLRPAAELHRDGLFVELAGYGLFAFLDLELVREETQPGVGELCRFLGGRGVASIQRGMRERVLDPVLAPLRWLVERPRLGALLDAVAGGDETDAAVDDIREPLVALLSAAADHAGIECAGDAIDAVARGVLDELATVVALTGARASDRGDLEAAMPSSPAYLADAAVCWIVLHGLGRIGGARHAPELSRAWLDEWLLESTFVDGLVSCGRERGRAERTLHAARVMMSGEGWLASGKGVDSEGIALAAAESVLAVADVQAFLGFNRHDGVLWFNRESFAELCACLRVVAGVEAASLSAAERQRWSVLADRAVDQLLRASESSGYRVERVLRELRRSEDLSHP